MGNHLSQKTIQSLNQLDKTGTYIINHTFRITNRGLVLAGDIVDGVILIGDMIEFTICNSARLWPILGIEDLRISKTNSVKTGLLIQCGNEDEVIELMEWQPDNQVCKIYKAV